MSFAILREGERASNSRQRKWGRQFQANDPAQAKHLEWAVKERVSRTTIRPHVEDCKQVLADGIRLETRKITLLN